jgi:hypothetical protein
MRKVAFAVGVLTMIAFTDCASAGDGSGSMLVIGSGSGLGLGPQNNVQAIVPPSSFWAICSVTPVERCRVQANVPIAAGSTCSCGTQRGQTR